MKNPFTNLDMSRLSLSKILLGLVAIVVALILVSVVINILNQATGIAQNSARSISPSMHYQDVGSDMAFNVAYEEKALSPNAYDSSNGGVGVYDEAEYETLAYNAQIKTAELTQVCDIVESWKPQVYIVFETATRNEHNCTYRFKVERAYAEDIAAAIATLEPNELTARTETVKKQLVEYDSQLSILLKKQQLISDTLEDSTAAFDEVMALATDIEDVDTLSKVINSKLAAIERLTRDRINLAQQIDVLSRRAAELADDVDFVQFVVYVQKYEVFDLDSMKDSWVYAIRNFTVDVNQTLQSLTLGLLLNLLVLVKLVLYVFIILFIVKFIWQLGKKVWLSGTEDKYTPRTSTYTPRTPTYTPPTPTPTYTPKTPTPTYTPKTPTKPTVVKKQTKLATQTKTRKRRTATTK